jgi:hypothetical protein
VAGVTRKPVFETRADVKKPLRWFRPPGEMAEILDPPRWVESKPHDISHIGHDGHIDGTNPVVTSTVTVATPVPGFASSFCCVCGEALPTQSTGRPQLTCSKACKTRRDRTLRKVERRRVWIALWRVEARRDGPYKQTEINTAIATLEQEINELMAALEGTT